MDKRFGSVNDDFFDRLRRLLWLNRVTLTLTGQWQRKEQ
jgi:hypothetical protein